MRKKHGSVLIITLGFVVAFTLLGMASLHYAMVQNEETERQKASMEAFWLADGAVEQAKAKYPGFIAKEEPAVHLLNSNGEEDLNRYYDVVSRKKKDQNGNDRLTRFEVLSYGKVNGQKRYIKAEMDKLGLPDFPLVTSLEPINSPVPPKIVDKVDTFAQEACDEPLLDAIAPDEFIGVTCLKVQNTEHIIIPVPSEDIVANVLVIDVTLINAGSIVPTITFSNSFEGIILVRGHVKFDELNLSNNNLRIDGTLIVDGQIEFVDNNNNAKPDAEIIFNAEKVDQALNWGINDFTFNKALKIISWEEVSQLGEEI